MFLDKRLVQNKFMLKKANTLLILFLLVTITMGFQCDKEHIEPDYQLFYENVNLTPARKVYHVNDTIWLRYTSSDKTFYDSISRQRLPTQLVKFGFGATLLPKHDTPLNPTDGFCIFILPNNATPKYSTSDQYGTSTYFTVDCDNASAYNIQLGVVLKQPGVYVLNLPDGVAVQACVNQKNPYPSAYLQFLYDLSDCNKDVYLSIPEKARQESPERFTERLIDLKVAYALKVQ